MAEVTTEDVRAVLNEITEATLATSTIADLINEAKEKLSVWGINLSTITPEQLIVAQRFIKLYAAYNGLLVARIWDQARIGDLSVKKDWQATLDRLKDKLQAVTDEVTNYVGVVIESTAGFDSRPLDPRRNEVSIDDDTIE